MASARSAVEAADFGEVLVDEVGEVVDLLVKRCATCTHVDAAGVMLAGEDGQLHTTAAAADPGELAELFSGPTDEGPMLDCFHTGAPVIEADVAAHRQKWPRMAAQALLRGAHAAAAVPLQLGGTVTGAIVGVLGMFATRPNGLTAGQVQIAQSLADFAGLTMRHQLRAHNADVLASQLQAALDSRVLIEQAKGMLAQHGGFGLDAAFQALRTYARTNQLRLHDVCRGVTSRTIAPTRILTLAQRPRRTNIPATDLRAEFPAGKRPAQVGP